MEDILNLINDIEIVLLELLSSGLNTAHEFTINEISRLGISCESYGLSYAKELLNSIENSLSNKRHNFYFDYSSVVQDYFKLNKYLIICKRKIQLEKVKNNIKN